MTLHRRVLIANRGEIAIRIAHAAAALDIESVAVFTPADANALHTRVATTSVPIGAADASDPVAGYLDADALVSAALDTDCDCLHPGYGFLSESAAFASKCAEAGLTFIGPSPEVLSLFGEKTRARVLARSVGVPIVPGSEGPVSVVEARAIADQLGFPVMVKAAAGGGGRGLRTVERAEDLDEALRRCSSEAEASFGDGSVFLERRVERPRHIEVQILGDSTGRVVHLAEHDCSVQLRNQKVVEIAPAPGLRPELRARLLGDAITLASAVGYVNAGTVEFLVVPETGEHFFIECNPRIQVEHTVTEEVTGIDLVQAQFLLAAGRTLAQLGVADTGPVGYAVQARVVATGTGTFTSYKEPTGPGVRVDACGYAGLTPPPQFDPLFAKVIGRGPTLGAALRRTAAAIRDFHVSGVPTNLGSLAAILGDDAVAAGDARTTLLAERPELLDAAPRASAVSALVDAARPVPVPTGSATTTRRSEAEVSDGEVGVVSPTSAQVVEVRVSEGAVVRAGDVVVVVSAMKMETAITAPVGGRVTSMAEFAVGDAVETGQVLVAIDPTADPGDISAWAPPQQRAPWSEVLAEVATLQRLAQERLAPGSVDPGVVRQRSRNKLTCRERIDLLLDAGSFREVGSITGFASYDEDGISAFTPANHVGGSGAIDGRRAIVCADDFTSRGGHADGAIGQKSVHLDRLSVELRVPSVRLLDGSSGGGSVAAMVPEQKAHGESTAQESSGAIMAGRPRVSGSGGSFLPPHLNSTLYAEQLSSVPVVNVLLGSVVGLGAAKAVLGHFSVMVRDIAQLFVAGPPVVAHAVGYEVTKEDLGDWRVHCRNGSVDNLALTEEEAIAQTKRFLSYLPSNVHELPPVSVSTDDPQRGSEEIASIVPRRRTTTFDIRRTIELLADEGSFMELGSLWGTDQVVGLVRFDGHPMGVVASDSRHVNGGAMTADGCDKVRRHLDVCDVFHVPVLNLIDNPGFAVGLDHEMAGTIRKGGEWMVACAQLRVPLFTVILRRSFGVAGNNAATPQAQPSVRYVWPSADVGGIPPEGGIEAAYKRQLAESADPAALRAEIEARIESARGPIGPLTRFQLEEMIDPRDTRALVCEWVRDAYRVGAHADRLGPRPQGFRP